MKKIFASLPMAGKSYAEIRKGQESLLRKAKDILGEPVELIESLFTDAPNGSAPLWYLARSLELLSSADYVIFAAGWATARGCRIEHRCAVEYGIKILGEEG